VVTYLPACDAVQSGSYSSQIMQRHIPNDRSIYCSLTRKILQISRILIPT